MQRRFAPDYVAKLLGVSKGTVIGWCQDGTMKAVNVARAKATRARWRMSEDDIADFEQQRANKKPTPETKSSGRTIQRPVKDYFATTGGGR